jgi:hypothetical protein
LSKLMPPTVAEVSEEEEVSVGEATSPVEASAADRTSLVKGSAVVPTLRVGILEALISLHLWVALALLEASGMAAPVPGMAAPLLGMEAIGMATIISRMTTSTITSTIAS